MSGFGALLSRDLRLAWRGRAEVLLVVAFFVVTAALFPFALGPGPELLARIAAGIIWVTALLSVLLSLERLFLADYEDGSLDLLALSPYPLEIIVSGKIAAHWITTGLPLVLTTPLIALIYGLPLEGLPVLLLALLLGTPALSAIGAAGAALSLGSRRGGVLIPLLVLPLYVPVLIFGVLAVEGALTGTGSKAYLLILAALMLGALPLGAFASGAALRQALE